LDPSKKLNSQRVKTCWYHELATKYESVRIASRGIGTSKSLVYLALLAAVVAVIVLAIVVL
jgi:hypothetical protein